MKIVHIITRLILGGAQENTLITCRYLAEMGYDITLITGPAIGPEGDLYYQTKNAPFNTIILDELIRPISPLNDIKAYIKLKAILKKLKPDVVHTHSAKAGIIGRYAADSIGVPLIIHSIHGNSFGSYQNKLLNKLYILIEKTASKHTDHFICVADAMKEECLSVGIGKPQEFTTAYSAIEQNEYLREYDQQEIKDFRRKYGISEQAIVFITIARLAKLKGHEFIIESAKKITTENLDCVWLFVGDGELANQIKDLVKLKSLRYKFIFTGLMPPEKIPLAIHSSDILVHTSLREGLARVLPQAMLCGKPVISFDVSGAKEVVNEQTGRLIETKNIAQLTDVCLELASDPHLRHRLGLNGRGAVAEKFSPEKMTETILNVYKQKLNTIQKAH